MKTAHARVRDVRNAYGMTMEEFGKQLGVSRASISNIENGQRNLTRQMASSICTKFGISFDWLMDGKGKMLADAEGDAAAQFAAANNLSDLEEVLLREYLKLKESEREIFRKYLKNVIAELGIEQAAANPAEMTIDEKVESYRAELEAEAASQKLKALQDTV